MSFIELKEEDPLKKQVDNLNSPNPTLRANAFVALLESRDKAVPFLLEAIKETENTQFIIDAIMILDQTGNPQAIDPLIKLFDHDHWRVRFNAIGVFDKFKAKKIIPKLKSKIVYDENKDVRQISLLVLGKMEEFDDIEFLKSLLKSNILYSSYFKAEVNRMIKKIESRAIRSRNLHPRGFGQAMTRKP